VFTGEEPPTPVKTPYDLNADGDVDLSDLDEFIEALFGP
jgi:hypothetical protein